MEAFQISSDSGRHVSIESRRAPQMLPTAVAGALD